MVGHSGRPDRLRRGLFRDPAPGHPYAGRNVRGPDRERRRPILANSMPTEPNPRPKRRSRASPRQRFRRFLIVLPPCARRIRPLRPQPAADETEAAPADGTESAGTRPLLPTQLEFAGDPAVPTNAPVNANPNPLNGTARPVSIANPTVALPSETLPSEPFPSEPVPDENGRAHV